jgi:hypothetical protein
MGHSLPTRDIVGRPPQGRQRGELSHRRTAMHRAAEAIPRTEAASRLVALGSCCCRKRPADLTRVYLPRREHRDAGRDASTVRGGGPECRSGAVVTPDHAAFRS